MAPTVLQNAVFFAPHFESQNSNHKIYCTTWNKKYHSHQIPFSDTYLFHSMAHMALANNNQTPTHIQTPTCTLPPTGSKYVPPHLRNRGGGASSEGGNNKSFNTDSNPPSSGRVGYGNRGGRGGDRGGYGGGDRRSGGYDGPHGGDRDSRPSSGPPSTGNSRWNNIDQEDSRGGGGYRGGRGGYGGGGYGGGRGRGPRVNERGFHGDMKPDSRLERQLFGRDDVQTTGINFDNYDDIPVETTGNDIPDPIDTYSIETIGEDLMKNTQLCGYQKPTPVQKYSVPIGSAGRDLMACAQTGSG
jgi:ATP-dependent RNA helicase DDX3X